MGVPGRSRVGNKCETRTLQLPVSGCLTLEQGRAGGDHRLGRRARTGHVRHADHRSGLRQGGQAARAGDDQQPPHHAPAGCANHGRGRHAGILHAFLGRGGRPRENAQDVTERISREVNAAFRRPDVRELLDRQAFEYAGSTPEEMAAFLKDQLEVWTRVAREAGIKPE